MRVPTYSVWLPSSHQAGRETLDRPEREVALVGSRPLVEYGRKRGMSFDGPKVRELGRLDEAPVGQRDLMIDEVPVAWPDVANVRLQHDEAATWQKELARLRAVARSRHRAKTRCSR